MWYVLQEKKLKNFLACFKIQYFSQAPDRATPVSRNTGCVAKGQNRGGQRGSTTSPYPGPDAGEEPQPALAPAAVPGRRQPRGTCCPLSCSSRKKGLVFHRNLPSLLSRAGDPSRSLVGLRRRGAAVPVSRVSRRHRTCSRHRGSSSLVMMGTARTNPCIWCH